ncbi:hypothetical protein C671_1331 [[Clostridium] bifermentans ATCC 19299]|nr:hypothetical protein C671_1331 [[Clostridium] bifermentans ATCC 19299] [Paraclostridium bifermentans ATCC 19299]
MADYNQLKDFTNYTLYKVCIRINLHKNNYLKQVNFKKGI